MKRVMVDVETMSVHNSEALLLSVAAMEFDYGVQHAASVPSGQVWGPALGNRALWVLDLQEQLLLGRRVDRGTQKFWAEQSDAARAHWRAPPSECRWSVVEFRLSFEKFVENVDELWANGVVFDVGNLASLWPDDPPWRYNCVRDARTVYKVTSPESDRKQVWDAIMTDPRFENAHDPVSDCERQVWELWVRGLR